MAARIRTPAAQRQVASDVLALCLVVSLSLVLRCAVTQRRSHDAGIQFRVRHPLAGIVNPSSLAGFF